MRADQRAGLPGFDGHHIILRHTCHRCAAYALDDQLELVILEDDRSYYVHREACS